VEVLDGQLLGGAEFIDVTFDDLLGFFQGGAIGFVFAGEFGDGFGELFDVLVEGVLEVAEDVFDGFGEGGFGETVEGAVLFVCHGVLCFLLIITLF